MTSTTSREIFLERKIQMLDQRLTAVEKFIDLRFRSAKENGGNNSGSGEGRNVTIKPRGYSNTNKRGSLKNEVQQDSDDEPKRQGSSRRKKVQVSSSGPSKKPKPCPASVKQRRAEKEETAKVKGIKDCAVRVVRTEISARNSGTETPSCSSILGTSSSGRTRRAPKRFQDEENVTPRGRRRRKWRSEEDDYDDDTSSVVKVERTDSPEVEQFDEDGDNDDGMASPVDHEEDDGEGYFTFPNPSKSPEKGGVVGRRDKKRRRKSVDVKSLVDENDDDDVEWEVEGDYGEDDDIDDDDIDEDEDLDDYDEKEQQPKRSKPTTSKARRGGRASSSNNSRSTSSRLGKKRGKYNVVKRDEYAAARKRKHVKLELTEIPTGAIANTDPGLKLCHLCNWHFKAEVFEAHLEAHARERHLKCPICDKSYYNQFILKKHMRVHEPEKYSKKCRHCGKPFVHSDKLLYHERYCVKKALEKNEHVDADLIEDLRKRSKSDTKWIEQAIENGSRLAAIVPGEKKLCPHCNRNFKVENFDRHVLTHTRAKNWSCNMCDKAYHYKHDLVRHVASDHVTVPTCEICEKTFTDRAELKLHATPCRREHRNKLRKEGKLRVKNLDGLLSDEEENTHEDEEMTPKKKEGSQELVVKREESGPVEEEAMEVEGEEKKRGYIQEGVEVVSEVLGSGVSSSGVNIQEENVAEVEENIILEVPSGAAIVMNVEEEVQHVLVFDDDAVEGTQVVTLGLVQHTNDDTPKIGAGD